MAKPILVINYCVEGMQMDFVVKNLHELQKAINESSANDEYYTFLLPVTTDSNIQVFYDKDFNETHYLELKDMIESKMKSFQEKSKNEVASEKINKIFDEFQSNGESSLTTFFRKIGILPR
jgi:predicted RNase H-like nuclease (RuvC/YqgF family)